MIHVLTQPNNLVGELKKTFQADAPDHTKIPVKDLLGATVVLISCSYHGQEFIRVGLSISTLALLTFMLQVGYFVHNDYESEELRETPPETPDLTQPITRSLFVRHNFGAIFAGSVLSPTTNLCALVLTFCSGISWQKNLG